MMRRAALIGLLFAACGSGTLPPPAKVGVGKADQRPDELMAANKQVAEREIRDIDDWVRRQGVNMERTGTGVRIKLVRDSAGPNARAGQLALVNYEVDLLNGTKCYTSEAGRPQPFRIEHDDVASGLHEAVQLMSPGDSAVIVIPSHRAFGLIGDQDKIPMRSTVIYRLGLVKIME